MSILFTLFLVGFGLIACVLFIASPLGGPVRRALATLWEYMVLSARMHANNPTLQARRRATQGGSRFMEVQEEWEMQSRTH
ncbi:hypothetical protein C8R46DRAFT_503669 [Mycena filopes]|nr:hypothetical protein C8R46DRAFT_503669 [Mycena filopes]